MFSGLGSRKALLSSRPGWVLPGAIIDLDFANGRSFGTSLSQVTNTRASSALAVDSFGNWHTFGATVPAITNLGLWAWDARTNLFLNSQAPATQSIAVVSGSVYTVSLYGTGSLVLSGAGTGTVTQGSPVSFVAGSTSLTVTTAGVTGAFINAQVELVPSATTAAMGFATPPILTSGSALTRAADFINTPLNGSIFANGISLWLQGTPSAPLAFSLSQYAAQSNDGTGNNRVAVYRGGTTGFASSFNEIAGTTIFVPSSAPWSTSTLGKISALSILNSLKMVFNNGTVFSTTPTGIPAQPTRLTIGSNSAVSAFNGVIGRIAVSPVSLLSQ